MKIPLNIVIEIDADTWRDEYLLDPDADIAEAVRAHFLKYAQTHLKYVGGDTPRAAYIAG